jgi:hypothetical protein
MENKEEKPITETATVSILETIKRIVRKVREKEKYK